MASRLTSSVSVDTEERGHMRVCLTHIYLLTWPFSACMHWVAKLSGRANMLVHFYDPESKLGVEANTQTFIQ